jgi:hypothetical protein
MIKKKTKQSVHLHVTMCPDLYHLYVAAGVVEAEIYLFIYLAYVFYIVKIYSVYIKITCLLL